MKGGMIRKTQQNKRKKEEEEEKKNISLVNEQNNYLHKSRGSRRMKTIYLREKKNKQSTGRKFFSDP